MKRLGWIAFLVGCGFHGTAPSTTSDGSTPPIDASVPDDTAPPQPPTDAAPPCFNTGLLGKLCLLAVPGADVTLSTPINTSTIATCTQTLSQAGSPTASPELCVITGKTITVQGTVNVTGSRALVLVAMTTLSVPAGAALDASSATASPQRMGAGANLGPCDAPSRPQDSAGGAGAAAGGSLSTQGSDGGDGNVGGNPLSTAKGGNAGKIQQAPTLLRGGCPGGKGGNSAMMNGGAGGNGGGALYLLAGSSITIAGDVFASGGGGDGGGAESGGGGGGTGGMIVLDAPVVATGASITITGRIAANGGAGASGGGGQAGGSPGRDGTTTSWSTAAAGGGGAGTGGGGGPGTAVNATNPANGGNSAGGGGGGGGGLGVVTIYGTVSGGVDGKTISPAPTVH